MGSDNFKLPPDQASPTFAHISFRRDAVRMATTSGLTRPHLSSDLGIGLSTLNKWVQLHQHDDLMSGPHEDVEKENTRLRKEVCLLRFPL
jgi:transposase